MPEKMRMPRLQNVNRLKITDKNISEDLLEEVARQAGLKVIDTESRWRNLSSVRPELVGRVLGKMEDFNPEGKLTQCKPVQLPLRQSGL